MSVNVKGAWIGYQSYRPAAARSRRRNDRQHIVGDGDERLAVLSVPLTRLLVSCSLLKALNCCRTFWMLTLLTWTPACRADSANTPFPFWRSVRARDDPRNVTRAGERV